MADVKPLGVRLPSEAHALALRRALASSKSDDLIAHLGKCISEVLKNLIKQPGICWHFAGTQVANPVLELVDSREQFVFARHPHHLSR
jgi:hypothetical protein